MNRREFIAGLGGAVAWPVVARAQQVQRVRRVGFLTYGSEIDPFSFPEKTLRDELAKLGWTEGTNLRLDFRFGNGDVTQTRVFAADLVRLAPDVIIAVYGAALRVEQQETKTIPIVVGGAGDFIESGTVRNPAHPEGNVTGFTNAFGSLGGKWLELLKEAAPNITRVAHLYQTSAGGIYLKSIESAGQSLGVRVVGIPVSDVAGVREAIGAFAAEPNGGLVPSPGVFAIAPEELIGFAAQYHMPAIYGNPFFAVNGGLMSYSADRGELIRGIATYVDRLLRGAKVGDLPVQYPTKFHLVINLKTAKALGLEVPTTLLARADEVIE
jgi:putative tryptophan/tyrosine transport system substrate-binding protein